MNLCMSESHHSKWPNCSSTVATHNFRSKQRRWYEPSVIIQHVHTYSCLAHSTCIAMPGQDKGQWAQTEAQEVPSEYEEEFLPSDVGNW